MRLLFHRRAEDGRISAVHFQESKQSSNYVIAEAVKAASSSSKTGHLPICLIMGKKGEETT